MALSVWSSGVQNVKSFVFECRVYVSLYFFCVCVNKQKAKKLFHYSYLCANLKLALCIELNRRLLKNVYKLFFFFILEVHLT